MEIGVAFAKGAATKAGEMALEGTINHLFSKDDKFIVFFGLFCDFREMPSYDEAGAEFNHVLSKTDASGLRITKDGHSFTYVTHWDSMDGCELPESRWEYDALIESAEDEEDVEESIISQCVSGLIIWLVPMSQGNTKEMMLSAYRCLESLEQGLREDTKLLVSKSRVFAFVRSDESTISGIGRRLRKKMNKSKLEGAIDSSSLAAGQALMTVPLKDSLTVISLADSIKPRLPFQW